MGQAGKVGCHEFTKRRWSAIAAVAAVGMGMLGSPARSLAQPVTETEPQPAPDAAAPEVLHNVIYRARADGTSRDAVVAYKMDDANVNSATADDACPARHSR